MTISGEILDWAGVLKADAAAVGGKAWQLARLWQLGLPVPDGLVIKVTALPQGAFQGGTQGEDMADEVSVERVEALRQALASRGWLDQPLAVRSSAVGEDSTKASFAGIYRSCLNVRGIGQILEAIRQVLDSLHSPAAIAYRHRLNPDQPGAAPAMAVIIMPLLPAVASGIAFTCDPVSGRDDRIVIHAQWGLGESLVGGQAAGDEYIFAQDALDDHRALLEQGRGGKLVKALARPDGGTEMVATSAAEAGNFVLSPSQASQLAELVHDASVALDFSHPFHDLEWVWDGECFWLTQARPVTVRPRYTYAALQDQPAYWTRGNTCEVVPDPLSAIDWSNSRKLVNGLLTQGYTMAEYPVLPGAQRAGLFGGRLYLELSLLQWECFDALGVLPKAVNALVGGQQPEIAIPPQTVSDRLARLLRLMRYMLRSPARRRKGMQAAQRAMTQAAQWRTQPLPENAAGLKAEIIRRFHAGRGAVDLFFLQGSSGAALSMLVEHLDKCFPGEGHALAAALLAGGEPSVTARQGYDLMALARLRSNVLKVLHEGSNSPGSPDSGADLVSGENHRFQRAYDDFLERYGHRGIYETYFRNPRWREMPEHLDSLLTQLAEVDDGAMRSRQQAAVEEAMARISKGVPFWKRAFILHLAKTAREECNQREAARSALSAYMEPERQALLAAGRYLTGQGALAREEDIFQLMLSEILRALDGDIPATGIKARVAERNRLFAQWSRETPPDLVVEAPARQAAQDAPQPVDNAANARDAGNAAYVGASRARRYKGIPTGTGCARGRACVLKHPSQGHKLQPGDILVARSTDPGWTPLFLSAGGLVVETGGYLSHGAIVAREFAIPAVVNLPGILAILKDGDLVEVDGRNGEVTLFGEQQLLPAVPV
ncbi:MAG: phosphoenolpyruvate synthase [Nitrosospira sp.]